MGFDKMRYILALGILCLAGCQSVIGPFQPREPERVDDPKLPLSEQGVRARDRYAIPEESPLVAPQSGNIFRGLR
jgi:hypothetical protein